MESYNGPLTGAPGAHVYYEMLWCIHCTVLLCTDWSYSVIACFMSLIQPLWTSFFILLFANTYLIFTCIQQNIPKLLILVLILRLRGYMFVNYVWLGCEGENDKCLLGNWLTVWFVCAPLDLNMSRVTMLSQTALLGEMARFECGIHGLPKPVIYWSHNGHDILPENDSR